MMDLKLFEHIYEQHVDELLKYALSYRCNQRQAEEMVQDVFLSLWQRHRDLTFTGDVKQYLYKAIKYKVFDFFRSETRKQALIDELQLQACSFQCFTEQEVSFNEVQKLIGHAVEKLPCRCREIYVMSRDQGLNNRDIARRLTISEKTVEQHLTKALKYIRRNLDASYQGYTI